jgi:hypothetical protein
MAGGADDTVQRELGQDRIHAGVPEAVTPADSGPEENLAVLGQEVEREQVGEPPPQHAVDNRGGR